MIQTILSKIDKWIKIFLLILAYATVISFTLAAIVFLAMTEEQIKLNYPDEIMQTLIIQMKDVFKILIWFLVPLTTIIIVLNVLKIYEWLYSKKQKNKKGKQKNGK